MLYNSARFSRATPVGPVDLGIFREKRYGDELIKKTAEYKIFMRGDDRYAVQMPAASLLTAKKRLDSRRRGSD